MVVGTPSRRIERPTTVDHRADLYSLGVVLYEMMTGELPLGRFPLPSERVASDPRLDQVVLRALEKEPARRYQQAGDVKTDVETIATGKGAPPQAAAPAVPDRPLRTRSPAPQRRRSSAWRSAGSSDGITGAGR